MTIRVGINGWGRIGRLVFRACEGDPDIEVVAVNARADTPTLAHLLKYDSVHRRFDHDVEPAENGLVISPRGGYVGAMEASRTVAITRGRTPEEIPWGDLGVDVVVESTGAFNDGQKCRGHLNNGAKRVVITAPAKNEDVTVVIGVNEGDYDPDKHFIISNASCTTNCLGPFAKVLHDSFGIRQGFMNTIHAYTNDQQILDKSHKDLRRARAAAMSIIPTSTGAAKAIGIVMPELKGKLDGISMRVPTPDGSAVDLVAELGTTVTRDDINAAMKAAAEGPLSGILEYCVDPIVSVDVIGNPASSIFDSLQTMVMGGTGTFVKCVAWYDNEWGYSSRVRDLVRIVG